MERISECDGFSSFSVSAGKVDGVKSLFPFFDMKTPVKRDSGEHPNSFLFFSRDVCGRMLRISPKHSVYHSSNGEQWHRVAGTTKKAKAIVAVEHFKDRVYLLDVDGAVYFATKENYEIASSS